MVNDVRALMNAVDKFRSSWRLKRAGLETPRVVVAQSLDEALRAVEEMGRAVVKPFYGSLGHGIEPVGRWAQGRVAGPLRRHRGLYRAQFVGRLRPGAARRA